MAHKDAIICDGMPMGFRAGLMHKDGSYWCFVPHRVAQAVTAADADIEVEADDVPMSDLIRGYNRLRGF